MTCYLLHSLKESIKGGEWTLAQSSNNLHWTMKSVPSSNNKQYSCFVEVPGCKILFQQNIDKTRFLVVLPKEYKEAFGASSGWFSKWAQEHTNGLKFSNHHEHEICNSTSSDNKDKCVFAIRMSSWIFPLDISVFDGSVVHAKDSDQLNQIIDKHGRSVTLIFHVQGTMGVVSQDNKTNNFINVSISNIRIDGLGNDTSTPIIDIFDEPNDNGHDDMCNMCKMHTADAIMFPCRHLSVCESCVIKKNNINNNAIENNMASECYKCHKPITAIGSYKRALVKYESLVK